jgi:hypothetical protein
MTGKENKLAPHPFFILAQSGNILSASGSGCDNPGDRESGNHYERGEVGSRDGKDA